MYSKVSRYWTKFQEYWTKHFQLSGGLDATDPQLSASSDPTFFRIILQKYIVGHCKDLVMWYMEKMIKEEIEVGQYVGTVIVKPGKRAIYVILWSVFLRRRTCIVNLGKKTVVLIGGSVLPNCHFRPPWPPLLPLPPLLHIHIHTAPTLPPFLPYRAQQWIHSQPCRWFTTLFYAYSKVW